MYNQYAIFTKFLDIYKLIAGNLVINPGIYLGVGIYLYFQT
mgnify:CR=1 FL=1